MNKTIEKIEKDIEAVSKMFKNRFNYIVEFVKNHRKLIITLVLVYLLFNFLFSSDEDEYEDE